MRNFTSDHHQYTSRRTFTANAQDTCADSVPFVVTRQPLACAFQATHHFPHSLLASTRGAPSRNAVNTLYQTRVTGSHRASSAFRGSHIIDICTRSQDHEGPRLLFELNTPQGPGHQHLPKFRSLPEDMCRRQHKLCRHGNDRRKQLLLR